MMRNNQIALLGTFAAGVLITGRGVGMAMIEYSSFQYGGDKLWCGDADSVKVLEFTIPEEEAVVILGENQHHDISRTMTLVESTETPVGILQYEVLYNELLAEPYLEYEGGSLDLHLAYGADAFKAWMKNKDVILKELKERTISNYDTVYVTEVTVKVNPDTMPWVREGF